MSARDLSGLAEALSPNSRLSTSTSSRLLYARDCSPRLLIQARGGTHGVSQPDAVVSAGSIDDVVATVRWCRSHGVPLVPYGAGSGVCGAAVPIQGGVTLDLKRLRSLDLSLAPSGLARVGVGWIGARLEHELTRVGFTLGHFPSSLGCSSVGGYLATRSAGQYSTRYGKIEDMVASVRYVDSEGVLRETYAATDDDTQILVGSEGMLGVIVDAWLRVERLPQSRHFRGYWCDSVGQGLDAMRRALQAGHQPSVLRLYDPFDSAIPGARKATAFPFAEATEATPHFGEHADEPVRWLPGGLDKREARTRAFRAINGAMARAGAATRWLNQLSGGVEKGCLLIAGIDEHDPVDAAVLADGLWSDLGASLKDLGPGPGNYWYAHRHDVSFKQSTVYRSGMFVDTMEVATSWPQVEPLYHAVRAAIAPHAFVMAHFSHAYWTGCSLYFTFAGFGRDNEDCALRYDALWERALQTVAATGAATTHHHGVGLLKARWLANDQPGGRPLFAAEQRRRDATRTFNPGKLWDAAGNP